MKPRSKIQKKIIKMSRDYMRHFNSYKEIENWKKQSFKNVAFSHYSKYLYCGDCGLKQSSDNKNCEKCNANFNSFMSSSDGITSDEFININYVDTYKNWQVVTTFIVFKMSAKKSRCSYATYPLFQTFINEKGKQYLISKKRTSMYFNNLTISSFDFNGDLEFRNNERDYGLRNAYIYPKRKLIKVLKRNGVKLNNRINCDLISYFIEVIHSPMAETISKANRIDLINYYMNSRYRFKKYWPQIKIALRRDYKPKNVGDWIDHIIVLERIGKDIHSPHYLFPENFNKEKQRYLNKLSELEERERLKEMELEKINYRNRIEKFLDFKLDVDEYSFSIVDSINDMYHHSKKMGHCGFDSEYYKKESLMFKVLKSGEDWATIEYEDGKVIQFRNRFNMNLNKELRTHLENKFLNKIKNYDFKKSTIAKKLKRKKRVYQGV